MLDAGCRMLDASCWMLDAGCWMLDFLMRDIFRKFCRFYLQIPLLCALRYKLKAGNKQEYAYNNRQQRF